MSQAQKWIEHTKEKKNKERHNCHSKELKLAPSRMKRA